MTTEEFCSAYFVERRGTNTLKWDALLEIFGDADLTPLWVADMEFKAPTAVVDAIKTRVEHGAFGYGTTPDSYFEAFLKWQKEKHGVIIEKEWVRFFTGVVGALYALVNSLTDPLDSIIICPPVYYPFYDAILNTGRTLVTCELDNKNGVYYLDPAKFEKEIVDHKVKMFILCSPHNPVSRVWNEEELEQIFAICKKHGVLVISDEIHQDFTYGDKKFIPAFGVANGAYNDILITVNSASKTFNLAGLIHSHTIIPNKALMEKYEAYIKTTGQPEANIFGIIGMEAAFRHGEEWLADLKKVIQQNYEYAKTEVAKRAPDIVITPLEGTYLMWVDLRAYVEPDKVAEYVREKCRLALDVGEWFSVNGKGFVRLNLATHPKYVKLAIDNILNNLK